MRKSASSETMSCLWENLFWLRKMEMKAALREKIKPIKQVAPEGKDAAPVFLWPQERKR